MKVFEPGQTIKLWITYQENGNIVTGLSDLSVKAIDSEENVILSSQSLTEIGSTGEYYYSWDTSGIDLTKFVVVSFFKGSDILCSEEYYFDIIEDGDSMAI